MFALLMVAMVVLLEALALGSVLPVLGKYGMELGLGADAAKWFVGVLLFLRTTPKVVMNPLWGRLSDRIGRRMGLVIATLGTLAGSVAWLAAMGPAWLVASQLLAGLFGSQAALAFAIASDTTEPSKRAGAMGMLGAAFGLGMTIGPVLGAVVATQDARYIGLLMIGFQAIALLVVTLFLPETSPTSPTSPTTPDDAADTDIQHDAAPPIINHRSSITNLLALCLLLSLAMSMLMPTFELYAEGVYQFTRPQIGYAFGMFGLLAIVAQGGLVRPMVNRLGEKLTVVAGGLILAAGLATLAASPPVMWLWFGVGLIGLGAGLSAPAQTAWLSHRVRPEAQGAAHGMNQAATSLGRGVAYLLAAILFAIASAPVALGAAALVAVAAAIQAGLTPSPAREQA